MFREDLPTRIVSVHNTKLELTETRESIEYGLDTQCVVIPTPRESSLCQFNVNEDSFESLAGGYEGTFVLEFGNKKTQEKMRIYGMSIVGMTRDMTMRTYEVNMVFDKKDVFIQTDRDIKAILMFKDTLDLLDGLEIE